MKNKKTIEEILKSWGENKRELPSDNNALKSQILAKAPAGVKLGPVRSPYARLPWLSFAFTAMAVLALFVNTAGRPGVPIQTISTMGSGRSAGDASVYSDAAPAAPAVPSFLSEQKMSPRYGAESMMPPSYYGGGQSLSDKREFLKVGYNATLKTREVGETTSKVENIVRGFGGRVDAVNSSEKWGYVSFAVPKESLGAFRAEMKSLVGDRFYIEDISSQNLLPVKQGIEENEKQVKNYLADLKAERGRVVKAHNLALDSYQNQIDSKNAEIVALSAEYQSASAERRSAILNRINQLQTEINSLKSQIASENRNYQSRISAIDSQIKNADESLKSVQRQDTELIESVATVNGTVSIQWVSLWAFTDAYLPGPLVFWILILAAGFSYLRHHRRALLVPDYF